MSKAEDPFYSRKQVPDAFIENIGETGLSRDEEYNNRERKFSLKGGDVRKFSNPGKGKDLDPFYQRKQIPSHMIEDVGVTGMTKAQELANRERKYSLADGSDVRHFSDGGKSGWTPPTDPYYGRKPVNKFETEGVGESGKTQAEEYEIRDRKQSLFQTSDDPFAQLSGHHRQSISAEAAPVAAAAFRRKSSAMAGGDVAKANAAHHSGYDGNAKLNSYNEKPELPEINAGESKLTGGGDAINPHPGHVPTHFDTTQDPDDVAPHETR